MGGRSRPRCQGGEIGQRARVGEEEHQAECSVSVLANLLRSLRTIVGRTLSAEPPELHRKANSPCARERGNVRGGALSGSDLNSASMSTRKLQTLEYSWPEIALHVCLLLRLRRHPHVAVLETIKQSRRSFVGFIAVER